ncbi:unnamed protein product [Dovyalis caffra]|uniref:Amine oxidase domain-containing protein n=1 Tax=Dovyalis caffra TaxID=77055 RepID=A0AAV1S5H4_9ROSI|nr:unnamed protein product [Dovyalis caffra]
MADAAIVVPFGVLKSQTKTFDPKLPNQKEEAIEDIGVGIADKIVFWLKVESLVVIAETSYGYSSCC